MTDCADSTRLVQPLFHEEGSGSTPTSALQLHIELIPFDAALELNRLWHSTLPRFGTGAVRNSAKRFTCFAATHSGIVYAVAIWSKPAARKLPLDWLELRRLAVAPDAPRNTPSRMLRIMEMLIRRKTSSVVRLITSHDMKAHTGSIYAAAGWTKTVVSKGGEWDVPSRHRPPVQSDSPKQRWEKILRNPVSEASREGQT